MGKTGIDYNLYKMSKSQKLYYIFLAWCFIMIIGLIFYHSFLISFIISPLCLLYPKIKTKEIIEERKKELNIQFKDMLLSVQSSLSSGKTFESSFKEALKDLDYLYPDNKNYIIHEIKIIIKKLELNKTVEECLDELAQRSHLEDIENFCDVIKICKRTGGNLVEVTENTTRMINDKIEILQEIDVILAEKKFEQKVMSIMPVALVLVLYLSSKDYMQPVFEGGGRIIMTVAIGLIGTGYYLSKRIMNIKV